MLSTAPIFANWHYQVIPIKIYHHDELSRETYRREIVDGGDGHETVNAYDNLGRLGQSTRWNNAGPIFWWDILTPLTLLVGLLFPV